ncbi:MAG: hypothetical protein O6943_06075 [Bacteroidetes bacterium]|nr:hypothetical protein [Bacteroidota bacterium]
MISSFHIAFLAFGVILVILGLIGRIKAGWDCTFTVSGTNLLVRVTGAVNNNVTWHTTTMVQNVGS